MCEKSSETGGVLQPGGVISLLRVVGAVTPVVRKVAWLSDCRCRLPLLTVPPVNAEEFHTHSGSQVRACVRAYV